MNAKKILQGTIAGTILSLIGLLIIAILYQIMGRTPAPAEIGLMVWASTIICSLCGNLARAVE